jgi:hypothetical protein
MHPLTEEIEPYFPELCPQIDLSYLNDATCQEYTVANSLRDLFPVIIIVISVRRGSETYVVWITYYARILRLATVLLIFRRRVLYTNHSGNW